MTMKQIRKKSEELCFPNYFTVSRERMGGGLAMLWCYEATVDIKSYSLHHIDAVVHSENVSYWRYTGIYWHLESTQKHHTWNLLTMLAELSLLPWFCFGDCNEKHISILTDFREALRECELMDLEFIGFPLTWSNRRFGLTWLKRDWIDFL